MTTNAARTRRSHVAVCAALLSGAALAGGILVVGGSTASASGQSPVGLTMRDDCEPLSFNAAVGPGTCVGDGDTTFDEMIGQLIANRDAPKWRFSSTRLTTKPGRALHIVNRGGEFHTFTRVAAFGGGCIPELNAVMGGLSPVAECQPEAAPGVPAAFLTSGAGPGQSLHVAGLPAGTHRFECLIHPWMRTTVVARD